MKFKSDIEVQAGLKDSSGAIGSLGQVLSSTASGVSWTSQSGFVPYIGATQDVNLGAHQLKADSLAVSTTSTEAVDVGEIVWNSIDGTFDMGLIGGVTLQAGQEMHIYGKATQAISNGDAVMFAGVQGDHILIAKADQLIVNANPEYFIGISTQSLNTNDFGYVTVFGNVRGLNTTAYTLGTVLYYNSGTPLAGSLTATEPIAPLAKIEVAAVVRVHATQGILLVRPHVMPRLSDMQDVYAPSPFSNDVLFWNSSNIRYETNTIPGILGYNPERQLTFNLPLNRVSNTISIQQATATLDGFLSSTDWTTFNNKQGALNGTGFVKVNGTTVSYDNSVYALDNAVVKLTGNQSIAGQKTFNNGIVSSVTSTYGGLDVTNSGGRGVSIQNTSGALFGLLINNDNTTTINPVVIQKQGAAVFTVSDTGNATAASFIRSGGTAAQILAANGSVITAGTNITISGGTISASGGTILNGTGFVRMSGTTPSYITGNQDQYVKADGSLSTAMNSRVEVNFVATAGQTTFTTPYEVGQIDVYYNGSKLYPNEFTATNGTSVVLQNPATLNAQISIVKYVAALSTTAIRNETTFTTTAGQTTFNVNYTPGQLDVFYNGSKLNVSEFTATNGTSVVLGFSCLVGESIVIVSYVNAVSGASGTANRVAKFTGAASLGDSQIFDNGTNVSIGTTLPISSSSLHLRGLASDPQNAFVVTTNSFSNLSSGSIIRIGHDATSGNTVANIQNLINGGAGIGNISFPTGNVGIGATIPITKMHIVGSASTGGVLRIENDQNQGDVNHGIINLVNTRTHAIGNDASIMFSGRDNGGTIHPRASIGMKIANASLAGDLVFNTRSDSNFSERMRITSFGSVGIGVTSPTNRLDVNGGGTFRSDAGGGFQLLTATDSNRGLFMGYNYSGNYALMESIEQMVAYRNLIINPNGGNVGIRTTSPGYTLHVNGSVAGNGAYNALSDKRYKKDIVPINKALSKILLLNGVSFNWNKDFNPDMNLDEENHIGLIAQEVEKIIPQVVSTSTDDNKTKSVAYSDLVPVLVEAIKEQQEQIKELQNEIILLKNK